MRKTINASPPAGGPVDQSAPSNTPLPSGKPDRGSPHERSNELEDVLDQLSFGSDHTKTAEALQAFGRAAELALFHRLETGDYWKRMAAYEVLEIIGSEASIPVLQAAVLNRSRSEQRRAKQALDAVRERISSSNANYGSAVESLRVFESE